MFGQQKGGFGTSGFGASSSTSLFGNKNNTAGGGLFGNTGGTTGFGGTSTTGGFGSFGNTSTGSIFGTPASKPGGGLFGTPTQGGFGTTTQSGFGGSTFGKTGAGLFGSSTPSSTGSTFGGGGLFGAASSFGNQVSGTGGVKFAPVGGNDTMMKNGLQQSISTKHQCITAMKEYESKSFEELRVDDYQAGRKGHAGGATSAFGAPSSSGTGFSFGAKTTASSLFGQSSAKPAFGTSGGLFGASNAASTASGGLFGAKPFGTAAPSSTGFSFGGTSTGGSLFGAAKPAGGMFGATTTAAGGGLFGSTGGSAFGTNTGFGGNNAGGSVFGKPGGGFGTTTQANTGFGGAGTSLFGGNKQTGGGLFGASTAFGQNNTGGSLFGGNKTGFGAGNTSTGGGLFGNTLNTGANQNKSLFGGGGFGTNTNLGGGSAFSFNTGANALGGGTGTGAFGTGAFGGGNMFGQQSNAGASNAGALALPSASNQQSTQVLQALLASPFGDSPLFKNNLTDSSKRQELLKPTNPVAQQAAIQSPVYRVASGSKPKIKPKARSNLSPRSANAHGKPHQLFAGLEPEEDAAVSNRSFVGRTSVKRLTIKVAPNNANYSTTTPRDSTPSSIKSGRIAKFNLSADDVVIPSVAENLEISSRERELSIENSRNPSSSLLPVDRSADSINRTAPEQESTQQESGTSIRLNESSKQSIAQSPVDVRQEQSDNTIRQEQSDNTIRQEQSGNAIRQEQSGYTIRQEQSDNTIPDSRVSGIRNRESALFEETAPSNSSIPSRPPLANDPSFHIPANEASTLFSNVDMHRDDDPNAIAPVPISSELSPNHDQIEIPGGSEPEEQERSESPSVSARTHKKPEVTVISTDAPTLFLCTMSDLNVHHLMPSTDSESSRVAVSPAASAPHLFHREDNERHPAGIVLKRTGYYTIPSMAELALMLDEHRRCRIVDFTIGRRGYGSVFFPGEVDITDMNLDEIVHIRRKEVTIYPDDDRKPPIGQGLNRPAQVTLDCVWPTDKATREPVVDPERLSHMKWGQKLEQTTTKMGARFLEYRPETGSWVFEVNHFSKYGLPESDDEVEVEVKQPKEGSNKTLAAPKKTALWSTRTQVDCEHTSSKRHVGLGGEGVYIGDAVESPGKKAFVESEMREVGFEPRDVISPVVGEMSSLSQKMALGLGVKPQRLQSMKESFFADEDDLSDCRPSLASPANSTNVIDPDQSFLQRTGGRIKGILMDRNELKSSSPLPALDKTSRPDKPKRLKKASFVDVAKPASSFSKLNQEGSLFSPMQKTILETAAPLPRPKLPCVSAPKRRVALQLPSSNINRESLLCDAAQFLGRSFRVGWGPGWTLVHSGLSVSRSTEDAKLDDDQSQFGIFSSQNKCLDQKFNVHVEVVKSSFHLPSPLLDSTPDPSDLPFLDIAWQHTNIVSNYDTRMEHSGATASLSLSKLDGRMVEHESSVPLLEPKKGVAAMREFAEAAAQAWTSVDTSDPDSGFTLAGYEVFGLCDTLWGERDEEANTKYAEQMRRKRMVVSWLVDAIEADSVTGRRRHPADSGPMDEIFRLVSDGRLNEAVNCSLKTGNGRLACLLSSSCSSNISSIAISKQLVEWLELESDRFISESSLKLYCLLASKPTWLTGEGSSMNTCAGLDWKRSLLLHLTYLCDPVAPLSDGVDLYRTAWKGKSEFGIYCAAPVPPYVERARETINDSEQEECPSRDTCYHLLRLYHKKSYRMEGALCPSSSVPHPLDYRLTWHVWRLLHAAGYRSNMKRNALASLHRSYAAQLESRGLWHQAVFVLMHITDSRHREALIRDLLGRYVTSDISSQQDQISFVFDDLGVSRSWLHECQALHAKTLSDHHQVALHLLNASHWESGHCALMRHVAADSLVHERFDYLRELLMMIENANASGFVKDWDIAGKVYLDHLVLSERVKRLEGENNSARDIEIEFESLWPEVTSLCQRVADLECRSAMDKLARADMAKRTLNLYNVMNSVLTERGLAADKNHSSGTRPVPSSVLASQTTRMRLPEDYAVEDLSRIARSHFMELVSLRKQTE